MEISYDNGSMVKKLFLIYSLNVADWVCTVALISSGLFYEANPLAGTFIGNLSAGFAVKCGLPLVVILVIVRLICGLDADGRRIADSFISFGLVFYIAICLDHVINFLLLFFG